jgi:putative ABC transport system permease protein
MHDLRLAARALVRDRGTSLLAILGLGLALGVNTGLFSALHAVLLRELPFAGAARVGSLLEGTFSAGRTSPVLSGGDLADLPGAIHAFAEVAGWRSQAINGGPAGNPVRLPGAVASTRFFRVFPAQVIVGRTFDPDLPVGTREAVLSERLWRRMFASDPGVVGRTLMLNGEPVPVVGVVAAEFAVPSGTEVWISPRFAVPDHPLRPLEDQSHDYGSNYLEAAARLTPGATFGSAQAELDAFSRRRAELHPETTSTERIQILPFRENLVGSVRPTLLLLCAAALFTLVLACANVAALLLARALRRRHALAIRVALGASRLQLFRMTCAEGLLLALAGAVVGVGLSRLMSPLLLALWPELTAEMLRPSAAVLAFSATLALSTTLAISVAPSLGRPADTGVLRAQDAAGAGGRRARGAREALVAGQIALTLVLLTSAGLLVRSIGQLENVSPGFEPSGVVTGSLWIPQVRYPDVERQHAFVRRVLAALGERSEVTEAAFASRIPLAGSNSDRSFVVPGRTDPVDVDFRLVTGDYFRTLRIPLRAGRTFLESEERAGAGVAMVNEEFVRRFLGGRDPLGLPLRLTEKQGEALNVVGVVGDVRFVSLDRPPRPEVYIPLGAESWPILNVVVRGGGSASVLQTALRDAVRTADPEQAFGRLVPMESLLDGSLADRTQAMQLLSLVAALAMLLALTGIYGVVAHAVAQRTRELGIRMALGATTARILRDLVLGAMRPVAVGLLIGLLATSAIVPVLRRFLFGVEPHDPLTLLVAGGGLCLVAIAANALAARRSSRASPALALQSD